MEEFARKRWLQSQNEKTKKVKHLYEISSSLFLKMHILKVMRFCCGKQPGGMLVFAFVE